LLEYYQIITNKVDFPYLYITFQLIPAKKWVIGSSFVSMFLETLIRIKHSSQLEGLANSNSTKIVKWLTFNFNWWLQSKFRVKWSSHHWCN
jgi:hypothetical protein